MIRSRRLPGRRQLERMNAFFVTSVDAELAACGASPEGNGYWSLETRVGRLVLSAVPSSIGPGGFVAMRFDDVERAVALLGARSHGAYASDLNGFSGKWNLNLYADLPEERIREEVRRRIGMVALRSGEVHGS